MKIEKIIHLCWFSGEKYPVEIRMCLDTWAKHLPDYEIKVWDSEAAHSLAIPFVDSALDCRKWAFAADVVRFYAVWKYGGIYMDSDIFLFRGIDEILSESASFITTFEAHTGDKSSQLTLQAAFFAGVKGNSFCKKMVDYYTNANFINEKGDAFSTVSPEVMLTIAESFGWNSKMTDKKQYLDNGVIVWPSKYISSTNTINKSNNFERKIGCHRVYGSWRKRKFGRRIELYIRHIWNVMIYSIRNPI